MADIDGFDIDALLSTSLKSAAEPEASAGVADAIRSRVAGGDAGTSVASSTAPGWGGGAGVLGWLPWLGLVVVAGLVGATLGVTGVFGAPEQPGGDAPAYLTSTSTLATGFICPGGPPAETLPGGTRVLAVARDDKGAYLGVRDPRNVSEVLFFRVGDLRLDAVGIDTGTLPVIACPVPSVTVITPPPVAPPATPVTPSNPGTGGNNPPPPPRDTTPPSAGSPKVSTGNCYAKIETTASDNVGVTSVTVSWTGQYTSGSAAMHKVGNVWTYELQGSTNITGNMTFKVVAKDKAGNVSPQKSATVNVQCLI